MQMGTSAEGVREAVGLSACSEKETSGNHFAYRIGTELAGEHYIPDVQHGMFDRLAYCSEEFR